MNTGIHMPSFYSALEKQRPCSLTLLWLWRDTNAKISVEINETFTTPTQRQQFISQSGKHKHSQIVFITQWWTVLHSGSTFGNETKELNSPSSNTGCNWISESQRSTWGYMISDVTGILCQKFNLKHLYIAVTIAP